MLQLFAHAEEAHTENSSELVHLLSEWYIAIPLFFAFVYLVIFVLKYQFNASFGVLANVTIGMLLVMGIFTYELVPALSIICIATGLAATLFLVLGSLAKK
jgi:hypothetical protein